MDSIQHLIIIPDFSQGIRSYLQEPDATQYLHTKCFAGPRKWSSRALNSCRRYESSADKTIHETLGRGIILYTNAFNIGTFEFTSVPATFLIKLSMVSVNFCICFSLCDMLLKGFPEAVVIPREAKNGSLESIRCFFCLSCGSIAVFVTLDSCVCTCTCAVSDLALGRVQSVLH